MRPLDYIVRLGDAFSRVEISTPQRATQEIELITAHVKATQRAQQPAIRKRVCYTAGRYAPLASKAKRSCHDVGRIDRSELEVNECIYCASSVLVGFCTIKCTKDGLEPFAPSEIRPFIIAR